MKRSMLLVLAGFGLASMLFALVAFVGSGNSVTETIIQVRIMENELRKGYVVVTFPDGHSETGELAKESFDSPSSNLDNYKVISQTFAKIVSEGYSLVSHTSNRHGTSLMENYVFVKK